MCTQNKEHTNAQSTHNNQAGGAGGGRRLGLGEGLAPGVVPAPGGVGGRTVSPADDAGEGSLGDAEEGPGALGAGGTATDGLALGGGPCVGEDEVMLGRVVWRARQHVITTTCNHGNMLL